ncbi:patatin-like phospholipase family protein [Rhodococcus globerulus]|uniref:Patatin-like phospholipase family protein n=1 Tax=Rhodococcus globerulus TaxID=33008 RepID=A0ABU4C3J2_RHOGO|nr:patatin-like phospholipase family protein [Rhodococcus globerulus]MDV6271070.1 patatin-like phospholipase family protein [Rhodococcus globerulus]
MAIGCGGTLGFAWTVAALASVQEALNWDPRDATAIIGTSAGAEFVTMLGSGIGVDELVAMQLGGPGARPELLAHIASAPGKLPPRPSMGIGNPRLVARRDLPILSRMSGIAPVGGGDPSWLGALAESLAPGDSWLPHPNAYMVSMDYRTGRRVAFGAARTPKATIGEALRASWAIPGWFPPVAIGGVRYIDGGASSTASVDLLLPLELDELVVLAPMASRTLRPARGAARIERAALRNFMSTGLDREIELVRAAGTKVLRIDATDHDLAVMGANFMDGRRRLATFESSLRTTRASVARELNLHPFRSPKAEAP